jgi:RNA ligase (TIGR02306 family)
MSSLIIEVCKIDNIIKHPNADKLSLITLKGWNVIVGLDQYKIGDLVVYCPPDSIIPTDLIEKYNLEYLKKNGKVGRIKLRGYLSEGLVLDLPEGNWKEGDNLADILKITKWQPPEAPAMRGARKVSQKKINPNFVRYTDIENFKNFNDIFTEDDVVIINEKIHGSNARYGNLEIVFDNKQPLFYRVKNWIRKNIFKETHEFVVGSHNVQISGNNNRHNYYSDDIWGRIAKKYDMKSIVPKDCIVYGEIYGNGIQDLTYGLKDIDIVIFDIKYKDKYLGWNDVWTFCNTHGLKVVPQLYSGSFSKEILDQYTNGLSLICPTQIREGVVVKMLEEGSHPKIGRKILKNLSADYLLRKNATEFK